MTREECEVDELHSKQLKSALSLTPLEVVILICLNEADGNKNYPWRADSWTTPVGHPSSVTRQSHWNVC